MLGAWPSKNYNFCFNVSSQRVSVCVFICPWWFAEGAECDGGGGSGLTLTLGTPVGLPGVVCVCLPAQLGWSVSVQMEI